MREGRERGDTQYFVLYSLQSIQYSREEGSGGGGGALGSIFAGYVPLVWHLKIPTPF